MGGDDPHFDTQDYLINWNAGPFGLVLRPDLGSDMPPCVAQVLQEPSVAKLSGVRAGDMLISVNGKKTTKLGYEKVVKMLYKERLPVVLHFRTPQAKRDANRRRMTGEYDDALLSQRSAASTPSGAQMQPFRRQQMPRSQDFDTRSITSTSTRAAPRMDAGDDRKTRKQYSAVWERGDLGISFRAYSSRVNVPCVDYIGNRGEGRGMERVCMNDVLIAINGEKTKALGVERVLRWLLVIEKPVVLRFHSSSNRIPQGQSNSIESYQPEYEPPRTASEAPRRLQVLYEPLPVSAASLQHEDQRRQTNQSVNSYRLDSPDRGNTRERRYTNNALPRDDQIVLQEQRRPQDKQRRYTNTKTPPPEFGQRVDEMRPGLRRHQSYDQASARRYSNGSQMSAFVPPMQQRRDERPERQSPVMQYASSSDRILYEAEQLQKKSQGSPHHQEKEEPPRDPELERPRQHLDSVATRELSFDEALRIVVRSSGKPITECVFGGVPILTIREGSVQAKLMLIFAKACLAKESDAPGGAPSVVARQRTESSASSASAVSLDVRPTVSAGDFTRDYPPQQESQRYTTGNPLGRHRSSQFLTYKFAQEYDDKRSRALSSDAVYTQPSTSQQLHGFVPYIAPSIKPEVPSPAPAPAQSRTPTTPNNRDATTPASSSTSSDFISLKDFVVQGDGQVADRATTSSANSSSTHVRSVDDGDDDTVSLSQNAEQKESVETKSDGRDSPVNGSDRRGLNKTDISIPPTSDNGNTSDMISLSDLVVDTSNADKQDDNEEKTNNEPAQDLEQEALEEKSSLLHPLIAELYWGLPDLHNIVKDKPVTTLLQKKEMLDEIQEILRSLQMEAQFERHSHLGIGTLPKLPDALDTPTSPPVTSSRGKRCYQCGKTGELADLTVDGGRRELYCQDCWEVFFFSEDRLQEADDAYSPSGTPHGTGRDSSDDEAFKYSFHDSSVSRSDMLNPWRYLNGGSSSIRDSTTTIGSSITDRTDEVWL
uniref:PDZ domain-containing protein n=1 Tax=Globisporangium ultimum (strain ATCC 200006 / CBS 805.95 / DAOM BR144) TaxID=431595 RepID=K3WDQ6_GLOUD